MQRRKKQERKNKQFWQSRHKVIDKYVMDEL